MAKYRNVSGQELEYPAVLGYGDPVKPNAHVEVPAALREQFDASPAFWARAAAAAKKAAPGKRAAKKTAAAKKTTTPPAPSPGDGSAAPVGADSEQKEND